MNPAVSVIMAAWNAERFIDEAVASVVGQTHPILELVVVNDGSTDGTADRLREWERRDRRVRVIHQENRGFAAARNRCLQEVRGDWIAVADADDVQLPHRIARQVQVIGADPGIGICGGGVEKWDGSATPGLRMTLPETDAEIRALMPFESPLFDPTAMYPARLLPDDRQLYGYDFKMAADYDLWSRLMQTGVRFRNLGEVLTRYRVHPTQITAISRATGRSLEERQRIWRRVLKSMLDLEPGERELEVHGLSASWPATVAPADLRDAPGWFARLVEANRRHGRLDRPTWEAGLSARWYWLHRHIQPKGPGVLRSYLGSPLSRNGAVSIRSKAGLVVKAFLGR